MRCNKVPISIKWIWQKQSFMHGANGENFVRIESFKYDEC